MDEISSRDFTMDSLPLPGRRLERPRQTWYKRTKILVRQLHDKRFTSLRNGCSNAYVCVCGEDKFGLHINFVPRKTELRETPENLINIWTCMAWHPNCSHSIYRNIEPLQWGQIMKRVFTTPFQSKKKKKKNTNHGLK